MEWVRKVLYSIVSVFNFYFLLQLPRVPPEKMFGECEYEFNSKLLRSVKQEGRIFGFSTLYYNNTNVKNMHLHRDSNPGPWNTVPML